MKESEAICRFIDCRTETRISIVKNVVVWIEMSFKGPLVEHLAISTVLLENGSVFRKWRLIGDWRSFGFELSTES